MHYRLVFELSIPPLRLALLHAVRVQQLGTFTSTGAPPQPCVQPASCIHHISYALIHYHSVSRDRDIHTSVSLEFSCYSRFPVGCPTRIHACAKFPIQNSRPSARMRGFSSRFLDNQLEIDCTVCLYREQ